MSAEVLGALAPGFRQFLIVLGALIVVSIGVAIMGSFASPKVAARARLANRYVLLTVLATIVLFPMYITVVNSLLEPDQLTHKPPRLFPTDPVWSTYRDAWDDGKVGSYVASSFIVTTIIVSAQLVTSILAAYAFAFLRFPLKRVLFVVFLATMMIPFEVVFFTNLQTIATIDDAPAIGRYFGLDTYGALALPFLATGFGVFLIRQAFLSLPHDLRDAAALDGYGHLRFLTRVAVPLSRPAIAALALFSFFGAWNQYLWPLLVSEEDHRTIQVGLKALLTSGLESTNRGFLSVPFAASVLAALPLFVLLIVFQKQLVRGLTAGAVKG